MPSNSISPIDGRYADKVEKLAPFFSESALMKYRTMVECEYLKALSEYGKVGLRKFTPAEIKTLEGLHQNWSDSSYERIKELEATTNHDVKAVEYFIKEKISKTSLRDSVEWVHFAITSEDTNNIAYSLLLSDALDRVLKIEIEKIVKELEALAKTHKDTAMLARTHGQSASPTTFGKEMNVFASRLKKHSDILKNVPISAKLNGATGNYNAHVAAYPKTDWLAFSKKFIDALNKNRSQKLEANLVTTQIECHDSYVAIFDTIRQINTILLGFDQDMWRYISDGWIKQKAKAGETGSSTMPHKVNPIDFENSEGNLGLANALFEFFARKLPISRLQRDLSDSTVERSFGTAFGYSLLAYTSLLKGLGKIEVNTRQMRRDLEGNPEVIAEAIQTVLRRENVPLPYEALKELTRGKKVTLEDFARFIDSLQVSEKVKGELKKITPENYTGLASRLAVL